MATHNANYTAVNLTGTHGPDYIGDGISASTIHQVFCITDGAILINALGGGSFTWTATAGQKVDILTSSVNVTGGAFVGFKALHQTRQFQMRGTN